MIYSHAYKLQSFEVSPHLGEYVCTMCFDQDDKQINKTNYLQFIHQDKHFVDICPDLIGLYKKYYGNEVDTDCSMIGFIDRECAPYCYDKLILNRISQHDILKAKACSAVLALKEGDYDYFHIFNKCCGNANAAKKILVFNIEQDIIFKLSKLLYPFHKELKFLFRCYGVRFERITADAILVADDAPSTIIKCPKCYFYHDNINNHELCERCYKVEILGEEEPDRFII